MRRHLILAALGSLLCVPAAAQRPTPDEQRHTLDTARDIAIHYSGKLPDFICTEQVERTDSILANHVKADRLTIQLSYFGQKEKQKLVAMNGKPTQQPLESLDGLITGGEFGSLLLGIFDPSASADFRWKESSNIRNRSVAVYTYRIARAETVGFVVRRVLLRARHVFLVDRVHDAAFDAHDHGLVTRVADDGAVEYTFRHARSLASGGARLEWS